MIKIKKIEDMVIRSCGRKINSNECPYDCMFYEYERSDSFFRNCKYEAYFGLLFREVEDIRDNKELLESINKEFAKDIVIDKETKCSKCVYYSERRGCIVRESPPGMPLGIDSCIEGISIAEYLLLGNN